MKTILKRERRKNSIYNREDNIPPERIMNNSKEGNNQLLECPENGIPTTKSYGLYYHKQNTSDHNSLYTLTHLQNLYKCYKMITITHIGSLRIRKSNGYCPYAIIKLQNKSSHSLYHYDMVSHTFTPHNIVTQRQHHRCLCT